MALSESFIAAKSAIFLLRSDFTGGSSVTCQCGWIGKIIQAVEVRHHNSKGDRTHTQYCCTKCGLSVAETLHIPPIKLKDQRDISDARRPGNDNIITFE